MNRNFDWDGDKVKETFVLQEPKKHTPKDILNGLDNTRNQIQQMKNQAVQLETQVKQNEDNLKNATEFEKELSEFEEKCVELQKERMLEIIRHVGDECKEKAQKSAAETIAKDPSAYTEAQKVNLPYLDYQKLLATHEKTADKISNRMVRILLYEEPIFDNLFEKKEVVEPEEAEKMETQSNPEEQE